MGCALTNIDVRMLPSIKKYIYKHKITANALRKGGVMALKVRTVHLAYRFKV